MASIVVLYHMIYSYPSELLTPQAVAAKGSPKYLFCTKKRSGNRGWWQTHSLLFSVLSRMSGSDPAVSTAAERMLMAGVKPSLLVV